MYGRSRRDDDGNSVYMKINSSTVGAIIGRKGSRIREMEQTSGARIKIHDSDDNSGGGERQIEIMGNAESQDAARQMIEQVLDGTFQDSYEESGGGGGGRYGGGGGGGSNACFKCGESGHFSRDCSSGGGGGMSRGRSFGGGGGRGGGGGGCYKCGENGHFARECTSSGGSDSYGGGGRSYDRGARW